MRAHSTPAHTVRATLDEEILAAIALSTTPPTAFAIAQRCPSAAETHQVSLRLQVLKRARRIIGLGDGRRARYRLAPGVRPQSASIARLGRREDPFGEESAPNTVQVRRDILAALEAAGHPLTQEEMVASVASARSRHELSQQIHVLLSQGYLETASGRPRLYWRTTRQLELDLTEPAPDLLKPQIRRLERGWAVRLRPGRAATMASVAPGLSVARAGARVIGIVIEDALLAEGAS